MGKALRTFLSVSVGIKLAVYLENVFCSEEQIVCDMTQSELQQIVQAAQLFF